VIKIVDVEVEEIIVLINGKDTMEEQIIKVKKIQISMTSLKINIMNVKSMVTIRKNVSLIIFDVIIAKNSLIISMNASLKTQIIRKYITNLWRLIRCFWDFVFGNCNTEKKKRCVFIDGLSHERKTWEGKI